MIIKTIAEERMKPCPFCGGKGELTIVTTSNGTMKYYIGCQDKECGCEITNPFSSVEDAVRAWNRGT